jgi:hypothetical protein
MPSRLRHSVTSPRLIHGLPSTVQPAKSHLDYVRCDRASLRANINETFLAAQIREQGEKEMNHDRGAEGCFGRAGFTGS